MAPTNTHRRALASVCATARACTHTHKRARTARPRENKAGLCQCKHGPFVTATRSRLVSSLPVAVRRLGEVKRWRSSRAAELHKETPGPCVYVSVPLRRKAAESDLYPRFFFLTLVRLPVAARWYTFYCSPCGLRRPGGGGGEGGGVKIFRRSGGLSRGWPVASTHLTEAKSADCDAELALLLVRSHRWKRDQFILWLS